MRSTFPVPIFLALLLAIGCSGVLSSLARARDTAWPPDGKARFRFVEDFATHRAPSDPTLFLDLKTEWRYECSNNEILSDVSVQGDRIRVRIRGLYLPQVCDKSFGRATKRIALNLDPGRYRLEIADGVQSGDFYVVTVTDSTVAVTPRSGSFTTLEVPLILRRPVRSFVFLCGTSNETTWIEDALTKLFMAVPSLREFTFPDSGECPYPTEGIGTYHDFPARFFRYDTESDFDSAGTILWAYSDSVISRRQGILASIQNWRNKQYDSWDRPPRK